MDKIERQLRARLRQNDLFHTLEDDNLSPAAVLVLLVKKDENWNILFTRRTNGVRTHQGEVSFPGGAYEEGDESLINTALRETKEEIGVNLENITILGALDACKTVTNFVVYPFVGILEWPAAFNLNKNEVERAFLIPIEWLFDTKNYHEKDHIINGVNIRRVIHYHDYDGEHLWGFTARVTQQILSLMR